MSDEDFDRDLSNVDRAALEDVAARLIAERPVPAPTFRGDLRRRIVSSARPRWRRRAIACLATGTALLAVAGFGVVGVGPLAPQPMDAGAQQAQVSAQ